LMLSTILTFIVQHLSLFLQCFAYLLISSQAIEEYKVDANRFGLYLAPPIANASNVLEDAMACHVRLSLTELEYKCCRLLTRARADSKKGKLEAAHARVLSVSCATSGS
jgi:hypothetical protein